MQANTSSTPVFFSALVTKPCGKKGSISLSFSKNDFTFLATTAGFSLSDLVNIRVNGISHLNNCSTNSKSIFWGACRYGYT